MNRELTTTIIDSAIAANIPRFSAQAVQPTVCSSIKALTSTKQASIVKAYFKSGFSIVEIGPNGISTSDPEQSILDLAEVFDLGEPFVPPLYRMGNYKGARLNRIAVECNGDINHPSFERTLGLPLHCDGTLQPLGQIRISVLYCESPAPSGGETILFNAAGAFAELTRRDLEAAQTFMAPTVLHRQANMNGSRETLVGPALRITPESTVECCFTLADTDSWHPEPGRSHAFERGLAFMKHLADTRNASSPYHLTFALGSNQLLLMRNTSISHGRTAYKNHAGQIRILHRGLFECDPKADV